MRMLGRRLIQVALAAAATLAVPASAQAVGVAYLDGKEVWVSSLDGASKLRLSNGEGDWTAVGQNDAGFVVGIQLEAGKIASLSRFTIWRPDGTIKDQGPLAGKGNGGSDAYPLGLELTPDAGSIVYGYSNLVYGFPVGTLTTGFFVLPSATRVSPVGGPYSVSAVRYPVLLGSRVVGSPDGRTLAVEDKSAPTANTYVPWPDIEVLAPYAIEDVEVSATGKTVALGVYESGSPAVRSSVIVIPTPGLGLAPVALDNLGDPGSCVVGTGETTQPSFSPDGASLAWAESRGVVVAGTPLVQIATEPDGVCTFSRPATVISSTGSYPSIGGIDVAAIIAARNPAPVGGGSGGGTGGTGGGGTIGGPGTAPPAVTFPKLKSLKLSALGGKSGASVELTPTVSGKATFTLTVEPKALGKSGKKPITIATGKATLTGGKSTKVKLKANATGKKSAKKLKKKQATLTTKVGGTTTSVVVKLS